VNLLAAVLQRVGACLDACGCPWALVGGFAVGARTEPRFTRDVDVAVVVGSDVEAEAVVRQLGRRGFTPFASIEHDVAGRLASIRLRADHPAAHRGIVVDVLFASSGIEQELVAAATREAVFDGVEVAVPRVGHLIALKLLSESDRRLQDRIDLQGLLAVSDAAELAVAREAVRLIRTRGYHRGRDLEASLGAWVEAERPDLA
jgi:predicted nucleotidyltransferase